MFLEVIVDVSKEDWNSEGFTGGFSLRVND